MSDKIKIVYQFPGAVSRIAEIPNTLKAFQKLVGGYIETLTLPNGLVMVIDEDGRLKGLPRNIGCERYGTIVGTLLITAADGDDFRSLTPKEIQDARAWLLRHSV